MKLIYTSSIVCMLVFPLYASMVELDELITQMKEGIHEVQSSDSRFDQQMSSPGQGVLLYKVEETDKKGKVTSSTYEFNLADIDPYTVREETSKDLIMVVLTVFNKQKLIKTTEDGEPGHYVDEVSILAKDIDNARQLSDLVRESIPLAELENENRLDIHSYEDMVNGLQERVKDVRIGEKLYDQEMSKGNYVGSMTFSKSFSDDKRSGQESYSFNLADINPNSLKFDISRDELGVGLETHRGQRIIQYKEDGIAKPFQKDFVVVTENVEDARDLIAILELAIPKATEQMETGLSEYPSESAALIGATGNVTSVRYGDETYEQTITPACLTRVSLKETDGKGIEKATQYELNLMDVNTKQLEASTSGEKMYLELNTLGDNDLIKSYENTVFDRYTDKIRIYVDDIEKARRLKNALIQSAEFCHLNYAEPFGESTDEKLAWILENVDEVKVGESTFEQKLEMVGDDNDQKMKFTKTEVTSKGGQEEVFEFNISDINPRSVTYAIRGDLLSVTCETNFGERIIKYYKDGEIQNYESRLSFVFDDVETARNVKNGLIAVADEQERD